MSSALVVHRKEADVLEPSVYKANTERVVLLVDDYTKKVTLKAKLTVPHKGTMASMWIVIAHYNYPESHHLD